MEDIDALKAKWYKIVDMLMVATDPKDIERLAMSEVKAGIAYFSALNGPLTKGEHIVAVAKKIEEECIADGKATIKPKNLIELQEAASDDGPMIATSGIKRHEVRTPEEPWLPTTDGRKCIRCGKVNPAPQEDCLLGKKVPGAGLEPHDFDIISYKEKVWRGVCIFCHRHEAREIKECTYGLSHEYIIALEKPKQVAKKDIALCKLCGLHPKNPNYSNNNCIHNEYETTFISII
jgi:hypothetical protein